MNTRAWSLINTISISDPFTGTDTLDIPFKVLSDGPYHFDKQTRMPHILDLRDYNGDGIATEFALFDAESCSDLFTTLIGYSAKRDQLVNYEIRVSYVGPGSEKRAFVTTWLEHLFNIKPIEPRLWKFRITYPGGPDVPWENWTVRYLPAQESFAAQCIATLK